MFTLTPEQAVAVGTLVLVGHTAAVVTLHAYEDLCRMGLDLPVGTIEIRQGDSFAAVTPDGVVIEQA
jgi:hypothetical protein